MFLFRLSFQILCVFTGLNRRFSVCCQTFNVTYLISEEDARSLCTITPCVHACVRARSRNSAWTGRVEKTFNKQNQNHTVQLHNQQTYTVHDFTLQTLTKHELTNSPNYFKKSLSYTRAHATTKLREHKLTWNTQFHTHQSHIYAFLTH